jgi:hypothetical protein
MLTVPWSLLLLLILLRLHLLSAVAEASGLL